MHLLLLALQDGVLGVARGATVALQVGVQDQGLDIIQFVLEWLAGGLRVERFGRGAAPPKIVVVLLASLQEHHTRVPGKDTVIWVCVK